MLLPSRLPRVSSGWPRRMPTSAVASSGSDVPIATRLRPTRPVAMPRRAAMPVNPLTDTCAPATIPARPRIIRHISPRLRGARRREASSSQRSRAGGSPASAPGSSPVLPGPAATSGSRSNHQVATTMVPPAARRPPSAGWSRRSAGGSRRAPRRPARRAPSTRRNDRRRSAWPAPPRRAPVPCWRRSNPRCRPSPRAGSPWAAAVTPTTNSGMLVPKPRITAPTTTGDMPRRAARRELPATSQWDPASNSASPTSAMTTSAAILSNSPAPARETWIEAVARIR